LCILNTLHYTPPLRQERGGRGYRGETREGLEERAFFVFVKGGIAAEVVFGEDVEGCVGFAEPSEQILINNINKVLGGREEGRGKSEEEFWAWHFLASA
jgi:hypothetical protein